jgi:ATP-dependent helicase/nuclease subunit B
LSIRLILGRAGSGKTRYCLDAVASELRRSPDGPPLILLVPEQATFQTDRALVAQPGVPGTLRASVVSFRRLAWRVLAETGGAARTHIDEAGKVMALRVLIERRRDELRVFAASAGKAGFLRRLAHTLGELHAYGLRPDDLEQGFLALTALKRDDTALAGKLRDLAVIGRDLETYLAGRWVDPDDYLSLLATKLAARPVPTAVAGASVWLDGFAGFTRQELGVLAALAGLAREVNVTLCLDPEDLGASRDGASTFHPTLRTYDALTALAVAAGAPPPDKVKLSGSPRFATAPALAHLEREYPRLAPPAFPGGDPHPAITLVGAESRRAEVAAAAREMVRLAREDGLRWREMALVTRSLDPYADLIEAAFSDYGIPLFLDRRRPVAYHPLVEFVRSSLEVALSNWAAEPVFRLLKTDLWPLGRDEVDILENYVLAHGVRGHAWTSQAPWRWRRVFALDETAPPTPADEKRLALIDGLRRRVTGLLGPFVAAVSRQDSTLRDLTVALWALLEAVGVPTTLRRWAADATAEGRHRLVQEHDQVAMGLVNLLDQLVHNLGDQPGQLAAFTRIIEAGLESLELGLVPPSLDQVMVGSIDRSRQPDVRAFFVLGANDGVFPAASPDDIVFSDSERAELAGFGLDLAPSSEEKAFGEDYLAYIALTRPSERLWVSYTRTDDRGRAMAPSSLVSRMRQAFPRLAQTTATLEPGAEEACAETEFLAGVTKTLSVALRTPPGAATDASPETSDPVSVGAVDPGWLHAYSWLVDRRVPDRRERTRAALRSLGYRNHATLGSSLARDLYGQTVRVSVSQLQDYAACPFRHFASAGLALEPRPRQQIKAPDIGSYFHAALSLFAKALRRERIDLADLEPEGIAERLDRAVEEITPRLQSEVLTSTARHRHLATRLTRTVGRTIEVLQDHARRSAFRPLAAELRFELADEAASFRWHGMVDRVEVASLGSREFVRVIDFKSSSQAYSIRDTYSGLDLQLPAYLLAASTAQASAAVNPGPGPTGSLIPAGALLFPVTDAYVRALGPLDENALAGERAKLSRTKGFLLDDRDVLGLMDRHLGGGPLALSSRPGSAPPLLPVTILKRGTPRRSKALLAPERMDLLLGFTRRKLAELSQGMRTGEIDILPARRSGGQSSCRFCDYRPVCRFDPGAGDEYRHLPQIKEDEVWRLMAAKEAARDGDSDGAGDRTG